MKLAPYPGWLFGWENPITQPESDPIYAVLTGFGHRKLSDSSDPGRVRTQSVLNVIGIGHRLTDEHLTQREISFIERETTALNTSCQEIQEPWLLAPSLGAPSCAMAREIPPSFREVRKRCISQFHSTRNFHQFSWLPIISPERPLRLF